MVKPNESTIRYLVRFWSAKVPCPLRSVDKATQSRLAGCVRGRQKDGPRHRLRHDLKQMSERSLGRLEFRSGPFQMSPGPHSTHLFFACLRPGPFQLVFMIRHPGCAKPDQSRMSFVGQVRPPSRSQASSDAPYLGVPMRFLDRTDLWDTVKPYMFQCYPNKETKRHNLNHSPCTVRVQNI
jgi:hypothetical protein